VDVGARPGESLALAFPPTPPAASVGMAKIEVTEGEYAEVR